MIPGYDEWKTSPPEDPPVIAHCCNCAEDLYENEEVYLDSEGDYYCKESCVLEAHGIERTYL